MNKLQLKTDFDDADETTIVEEDLGLYLDAIAGRKFDNAKDVHHHNGQALRNMAGTLQGQSLQSMRLLSGVSGNLSELMCLSAWANGNAQKLSSESNAISTAIEEIATTVRNIADAGSSASGQTEQAKALAITCVERSKTAENVMTEISGSFQQLDGRMQSLDDAVTNIGGFAKDIEGISNQTKLLALNATIEAARAGEAGRGFAVVAAEVKSLSEQTSKTTEMIGRQLSMLDEVMQSMIDAMTAGGTKVRDGASSFNAVVGDIGEMHKCIDAADSEITGMTEALTVQSEVIDSVVKNISEIAGLAKNNSDDSVNAVKLIHLAEEMIAGELSNFDSAQIPNQAVWRLRADHLNWKQQLAESLVGLKDAKDLCPHMLGLPLGIWYSQIDNSSIKNHRACQALVPLEQQMKDAGRKIAEGMTSGDIGGAIGAFFGMEEQSGEALKCIADLEVMAT